MSDFIVIFGAVADFGLQLKHCTSSATVMEEVDRLHP